MRLGNWSVKLGCAFAAASLACGFVPASASAAGMVKVKMALPVKVLVAAPIFLAVDSGALKKRNIDMDVVVFRGGPPAIAALLSGEVQFMSVAVDEFLKVAGKGKVLRVLTYAHGNTLNLQMGNAFIKKHHVRLDLPLKQRIRQLKGATLGTVTLGGATEIYARWMFKYAGLDPHRDLRILRIGGLPAMIAGVGAGKIDGFLLSPPAGQIMEAKHLGKMVVPHNDVPPFRHHEYFGVTVTPSYLAAHKALVKNVVAAIKEGEAMLNHDPKKAAEVLHHGSFKTLPLPLLEASLRQMKDVFRPQPMTAEAWRETVGLMRDAGFKEVEHLKLKEGQDWINE